MKIKDCGVAVLHLRQLEITYSIGGLDSNSTTIKVKVFGRTHESKSQSYTIRSQTLR